MKFIVVDNDKNKMVELVWDIFIMNIIILSHLSLPIQSKYINDYELNSTALKYTGNDMLKQNKLL